jgi:DNA polymerase-3 subunit epsilon
VRQVRDAVTRRPDEVVETIEAKMAELASAERFEQAAAHRDRLASFLRAASRAQRLGPLLDCPEIVATRREDDGRWAVHVVRHGRLAAAGVIPSGSDARAYVDRLRASAETVLPDPAAPPASAEETERILAWLERPGLRLVDVEGEWTCPVAGAARHLDRVAVRPPLQ